MRPSLEMGLAPRVQGQGKSNHSLELLADSRRVRSGLNRRGGVGRNSATVAMPTKKKREFEAACSEVVRSSEVVGNRFCHGPGKGTASLAVRKVEPEGHNLLSVQRLTERGQMRMSLVGSTAVGEDQSGDGAFFALDEQWRGAGLFYS